MGESEERGGRGFTFEDITSRLKEEGIEFEVEREPSPGNGFFRDSKIAVMELNFDRKKYFGKERKAAIVDIESEKPHPWADVHVTFYDYCAYHDLTELSNTELADFSGNIEIEDGLAVERTILKTFKKYS